MTTNKTKILMMAKKVRETKDNKEAALLLFLHFFLSCGSGLYLNFLYRLFRNNSGYRICRNDVLSLFYYFFLNAFFNRSLFLCAILW